MKKNNVIMQVEEVKDFQKGYLTLPFDGDQFAGFITGLLGKPQAITKRIKGNFEVHLKDLQNFHELINQRIVQQNKGQLMQLKTKIYYNDESSILLSSYEELVSYNEVKPIVSEAVRMTWTYLIQFADKTSPEKQEIELMVISTPSRNLIEDDDIPVLYPSYGEIRVLIQHTARSWGADIESLLTNQINSIMIPCVKWKDYLRKKSGTIGILVGLLFLMSSMVSIYFTTINFNKNEVTKVSTFIKDNSKDVVAKTDYVINYIASNVQDFFFLKSLLFIVVSLFVAIILGVWVESQANIRYRSYLVLTREAKNLRDILVNRSQRKIWYFFFSVAGSVLSGIIANYIFKMLSGI